MPFPFPIQIPVTFPDTAPEIALPELEGKTAKMFRYTHNNCSLNALFGVHNIFAYAWLHPSIHSDNIT